MSQPVPASEPEFAAFIAIDWADREHAWAMQLAGSSQRESGKLKQTPQDIEAWAMQWATRFAGRPVAVALEQSRGALLYALQKYPHLVLYVVHPSTSHDYRKAVFPSGSKDDPKDAGVVLLDLLTRHRDRLRMLRPDTEQTRKLRLLVEHRRQLVDQRTAHNNRLTNLLKMCFPQVLDWFDNLTAPIVGAFLQRWPTLAKVQQEDPEVVRSFFYQKGSRSQQRIESRLEQIRQATPLIDDPAVIDPAVLMVETLLAGIEVFNRGIQAVEKAIQELAAVHPDYPIFASFPGAGAAMAPRLLVAFGTQRDRYASADEILAFSGIAPVKQQSGDQCWIHFRWKCPKFFRQTFHEFAALSIQQCDWARAFYDQQRDKKKGHHAAVRSLAFKWVRILFRCWQDRQPYREQWYVAARQARAIPVPRSTPPAANTPHQVRRGKAEESLLKSAGEILKNLAASS